MHIKLVDFVLFLHIGVAVLAFAIAAVLITGLLQMRAATDVAVLRASARMTHRLEPVFPILVVALIGLGAWLIHLSGGEFRWSDGWVVTAVAGLIVMEVYGGAVLAPAGKRLHEMVEAAPDGPVTGELQAAIRNPLVWGGAFGNTGVALGILFLMPTKPVGWAAVLIVVLAGAASIGLGLWLASPRAAAASGPRRVEHVEAVAAPVVQYSGTD